MPGAAHSQNEDEFAGFAESSADVSAVPIDVVSQEGVSEAQALANLKWEQKKGQLYLGLILFAATVAVFVEAGSNKGIQSTLENETSSDDLESLDNTTIMSCTDPRPDPLTNSTAHFGDCCSVYGVT